MGRELRTLFAQHRRIVPEAGYYHVGIGLSGANGAEWQVQTHWEGWVDADHRIERRTAKPVDPHWLAESWRQSGTPYFVVNTTSDLAVFLAFGGNALVATSIAESHLPDVIRKFATHEDETGFRVERVASEPQRVPATARPGKPTLARPGCALCRPSPGRPTRGRLRLRPIRSPAIGGSAEAKNFIALCPSCDARLWNGALDALPDTSPSTLLSPYLEMRHYRDWLVAHTRLARSRPDVG